MDYRAILDKLREEGNLRKLPQLEHSGRNISAGQGSMLNLSSNDYLGLASDTEFYKSFLSRMVMTASEASSQDGAGMPFLGVNGEIPEQLLFSSSSSRLLTGNFEIYETLEEKLRDLYGKEAALVFGSGYHANSGILPAVTGEDDIILADKLVHASLIDGIRLSRARTIRFRHQDLDQLETLLKKNNDGKGKVFIVTESIFSMDGDVTDLRRLAELKKRYDNVLLYVDEAHAVGVRGADGLGVAQEQDCIGDVDFLVGTLGKALASVGAYVVCSSLMREFLVNKARTFIFTTALPPVNMLWTLHVLNSLPEMKQRRAHLDKISAMLRGAIGPDCISDSHIVPVMVGESRRAIEMAEWFQRQGFLLMPVRPPTVPEGTSRLRISLTAAVPEQEVRCLTELLQGYPGK